MAKPCTCTACQLISAAYPAKEGEVTEGVFEKYRIATYKASWKPYIIAAMILSRKYAKPGALLEQLLKEAQNA